MVKGPLQGYPLDSYLTYYENKAHFIPADTLYPLVAHLPTDYGTSYNVGTGNVTVEKRGGDEGRRKK
jgi:hypothetical protein